MDIKGLTARRLEEREMSKKRDLRRVKYVRRPVKDHLKTHGASESVFVVKSSVYRRQAL